MRTIRSDKHQVMSYTINKIGLSCYDDKRFILDDGKTTLAFGNKSSRIIKEQADGEPSRLVVRKRKWTADHGGSAEEASAKRSTARCDVARQLMSRLSIPTHVHIFERLIYRKSGSASYIVRQ